METPSAPKTFPIIAVVALLFVAAALFFSLRSGAPQPNAGRESSELVASPAFWDFFATLPEEQQFCAKEALGDEYQPLLEERGYRIRDEERIAAANRCFR